MSQVSTPFDSPWKNVLECFFESFMLFFFPQIHQNIDWSRGYDNFGCELSFKFPVVKLSDYRSKWEELEQSNNPFSIIVRTHLKGLATHNASKQRCHWKIELYKALYEANYSKEEILELYRFMDWVLILPEKYARQFDDFVEEYEEAKKVEYVTSIERRGIEKGIQQGRLDGQRVIIENLLKSRFGGLDERLVDVIEPLLQLSPDESSRLLLQSSREDLLARFLH